MKLTLIYYLFLQVLSLNVAFIYSPANPCLLLSPTSESSSFHQYLIESTSEIPSILSDPLLDLVFDLTHSTILSLKLQDFCDSSSLLYLQGYYSQTNTLQLAYAPSSETSAIFSLLSSLQIKNWALVYSTEFIQSYSSLIKASSLALPISTSISASQLLKHLGDLKFSQINTIVVLLPADTAAFLLQVCSIPDFLGYSWLFSARSDYLQYSNSSTYTLQGTLRLSTTTGQYWPELVLEKLANAPADNFTLYLHSEFLFDHNRLAGQFFVLNVVEDTYISVGACSPACDITREITWPTGVTDVQNTMKRLNISYESSLFDPHGNYLSFLVPAYQGIELGLVYANNQSSLFQLVATPLQLGGSYFNESYVDKDLSLQAPYLGIATIAPAMSELAIGLYQSLQNRSISLPMLGYSDTVSLLSSSVQFPWYARVCMPDPYVTSIIALMINYFSWTRLGVVYLDNLFSSSVYSEFYSLALVQGIQIVNQENNKLNGNSGAWTNEDLDPILITLGESGARIVLVICYTDEIDKILVRMNELGYYGSEYEYIAVGWLVDELLNPEGDYNATRLEILRNSLTGSLMFFPVSFIGDFGAEVQQMYEGVYGSQPVGYTSYAFDAVLGLAATIEALLVMEKDYSDPSLFMQELRGVRFQGTTGLVTFKELSNDRSPMDHYIINTKKYNDSTWHVETIGLYSPASSNVFTFYQSITWPGDIVPLDSPPPQLCPFPQSAVHYTLSGTAILSLVLILVLFLNFLAAFIGWRSLKHIKYPLITEKKYEITFYDMLGLLKIIIEFIQCIGLIPSLPAILQIFQLLGEACSLNLDTFYSAYPLIYWRIYQLILSTTGLLMLFRIIHRFNANLKLPCFRALIYIFGDLLYISILTTLLNIYLCQQSASLPFLQYDCYTNCWESTHLGFIFANSIVLVVYCLVVVLEKPRWNTASSEEQHLLMRPSQTYVRSTVQCCVVCLKKVLWLIGVQAYLVALVLFFTASFAISVRCKPYNVEVVNLWNSAGYLGLICVAIIALVCEVLGAQNSSVWLIVIMVNWACIILVAVMYQKRKKLVWPFFSYDYDMTLLRFAFQRATLQELQKSREVSQEFTFRPNSAAVKC